MSEVDQSSELKNRILDPANRPLRILAAQGLVPLPPIELVPIQVELAGAEDTEVAAAAAAGLDSMDPTLAARLVADGTEQAVVAYFARHLSHTVVREAILRRRDTGPEILSELARVLPADLQEVLLFRQDQIVESPQILEALEENPEISTYSKRRIREYREHLLPRERVEPTPREILEAEADALTEEEIKHALDEARGKEEGKGEVDEETTGLSESQIRSLAVPVRLKLTRGASAGLRNLLIRDPHPMVATSVLHNNAMADGEIERIANNRAVIQEVLDAIAQNRTWTRKYSIVSALVRNPRSPVGVAIRLLPRLSVRDLQMVGKDRNVANAVREAAQRLFKKKKH